MLEEFFVFKPSPWENRNWAAVSGLPLEEVWVPVDEAVTVFGWFLDAGPGHPVLLWCHGNSGNVTNRLSKLGELYRRRLSVFIFDYRGYGRSTGTPSEEGLYQDALACYDYLVRRRRLPTRQIVIFGRSLGSSVAMEVATTRSAAGLILEGAFPSIQAMADYHYWGLPAHWVVDVKFDVLKKIGNLVIPLLMVHGDKDSEVPITMGRQIFEAARKPKHWYVVPGADHNKVAEVGGNGYFQSILDFIRWVVPGKW